MDKLYQKLNKKLDTLTYQANGDHNNRQRQWNPKHQQRIINMTDIQLTNEQIKTLSLGPKYAIEQEPKLYINELIVDTENAIRTLEPKIQYTYRHLAIKQIKRISMTGKKNILHKRHQHNLNEIKKTLVKADNSKAIVIIKMDILSKKVDTFIKDNNIKQINKDPTEKYQRIIQQTLQKSNLIIEKQNQKYLMNIKPAPPKLNVYIKTHKENEPIRPVIDNTQAPSYKIAKHINKKLHSLTCQTHIIQKIPKK